MLEAQILALPDTPDVRMLPFQRICSIAAFRGGTETLEIALGVTLPRTPRRILAGNTTYLWSGADAWLAVSANPALEIRLTTAAQNCAAVTDQSDARIIFSIAGAALAKIIPIDLHPTAFPPDAAALTLAGHIPVQLWQDDDQSFRITCMRSYAASLYESFATFS